MPEYKKITDAQVLDTVKDEANVFVEQDGKLCKVPKNMVGGAGGGVRWVTIGQEGGHRHLYDGKYTQSTLPDTRMTRAELAEAFGASTIRIFYAPSNYTGTMYSYHPSDDYDVVYFSHQDSYTENIMVYD